MAFPKPYFLDCDRNLQSAVKMHPDKEFFYDTPDLDEKGNLLPEHKRWKRLMQLLIENACKPEVGTIVIDSMSRVDEYLRDFLVAEGSEAGRPVKGGGLLLMNMSLWYPYQIHLSRMITGLKATGKYVICISHETVDVDEATGVTTYYPAIGGRLRTTIGKYFTDVWRTEAVARSAGVEYTVKTQPMARMSLGNSQDLPNNWKFNWKELEAKLVKKPKLIEKPKATLHVV